MPVHILKYFSPLTIYVSAYLCFTVHGWVTWLPVLFAWVILPVVELFISPTDNDLDKAEKQLSKNDRFYDYVLYFFVLLQFVAVFAFLDSFKQPNLAWWEIMGRIYGMGVLCGTFGINIGHELGHRVNRFERGLAKASLLTSLYMHFYIEHNRGHHKNVATPEDPSSARYNENVYAFYLRTIYYSYLSAWRIANNDMRKKKLPVSHPCNEMIQAHLIQLVFVAAIWFLFGTAVTLYFWGAATMGILLLETVNYIEHYGLQRRQSSTGSFERAMPWHSWNSNHILGRLMLFELSRHSDHHYMASRKYQVLEHHPEAPQLPTGYPGSMLLAMVPPLWFYVMNRRIEAFQSKHLSTNLNLSPQ